MEPVRARVKQPGAARRLPAGLGCLLVTAIVACGGCDYFRPAVPETSTLGSGIIPNYRQPDSTLTTLARGIQDKGRTNGLAAYIGGFADSTNDGREFHAFFDPATVNRMQQRGISPPDDWNRGHEEQDFYPRFVTLSTVPAEAEYLVTWIKDPTPGEDDYGSETATLYREYRVYGILGGETQHIARGFASLYFVKVSSKWLLVRWDDREATNADLASGELCWGQRRLEP